MISRDSGIAGLIFGLAAQIQCYLDRQQEEDELDGGGHEEEEDDKDDGDDAPEPAPKAK